MKEFLDEVTRTFNMSRGDVLKYMLGFLAGTFSFFLAIVLQGLIVWLWSSF